MDIYEEIKKHLKNEYDDVIKYVELSKADTNDGEKQILKDIAHEEFTHATHLEEILKEAGKDVFSDPAFSDSHEKAEKALNDV